MDFFPCVLEKKSCGHVANEFLNNSEKILKKTSYQNSQAFWRNDQ